MYEAREMGADEYPHHHGLDRRVGTGLRSIRTASPRTMVSSTFDVEAAFATSEAYCLVGGTATADR